MEVGRVEAVGRANAHGETGRARGAGEADLAAGSRHHRGADGAGDVDAAMLPAGVRIVAIAVCGDHRAAKGPNPFGVGGRGRCKERDDGGCEEETHGSDRTRGTAQETGLVAIVCAFVTAL
jgi:hypothetical protein